MNENNNLPFAGRRDADCDNNTIHMDIRQGQFCQWLGKDRPSPEYDYVQGHLTGITFRKCESASGETIFMDLHFVNGKSRFEVSALASSSISAELVARLANIRDFSSTIRIDVWLKDSFTNCSVRENGQKVPYRVLPKVERRQEGFKTILDTVERDTAVQVIVDEINTRLVEEMV